MNLQVNLIRTSEERSANIINLKSVIWISAVIVPVVCLLLIAWASIGYAEKRSTLNLIEHRWEDIQQKQGRVNELNAQLRTLRGYHEEITGWNRSRISWEDFLSELQRFVPNVVQLRTMQMRQNIRLTDGQPVRTYTVTIGGRCLGPRAEARVEALRRALADQSALQPYIRHTEVTAFREDQTSGAGPEDRAFQIDIEFHSRMFREAAGE